MRIPRSEFTQRLNVYEAMSWSLFESAFISAWELQMAHERNKDFAW